MKIYIPLIFILLVPILSFGQTESVDSSNYNLGFKLGYFYPTKTSFKNFYNQSLGDFPLSSITVELEYDYKNDLHLFVETKVVHNQLESHSERRLFLIPTFLGFKYISENSKNSNYFAGIGVGFYWIQMRFEKVREVDDFGNEIKLHDVFLKSYFGVGIKPFIGFDFKIAKTSRLGVQFDYDISYIGNADKGGLGNTGGLLTNLFL